MDTKLQSTSADQLQELAAVLTGGPQRSVMITGTAGAGKSWTLNRLAQLAAADGRSVVWIGPGFEYAVVDTPGRSSSQIVSLDAGHDAPGVIERFAAGQCQLDDDQHSPFVVFVDDLNGLADCDAAHARALLHSLRDRISIAVTIRDQLGTTGEVGRLVDDLQSIFVPTIRRLEPWDESDVCRWYHTETGSPLLASSGQILARWSEHRPGWIVAVARALSPDGFHATGGHHVLSSSIAQAADAVDHLISSRLGEEGGIRWSLAKIIAACVEISIPNLRLVANELGMSQSDTDEARSALTRESLLRRCDTCGRSTMVNPLIRQVVLARSSRHEQATLARALLECARRTQCDDLSEAVARTASNVALQPSDTAVVHDCASRATVFHPDLSRATVTQLRQLIDPAAIEMAAAIDVTRSIVEADTSLAVFDASARHLDPDARARVGALWLSRWRIRDDHPDQDAVAYLEQVAAQATNVGALHRELAMVARQTGQHARADVLARQAIDTDLDTSLSVAIDDDAIIATGDVYRLRNRSAHDHFPAIRSLIRLLEAAAVHLAAGEVADAHALLDTMSTRRVAGAIRDRYVELQALAEVLAGGEPEIPTARELGPLTIARAVCRRRSGAGDRTIDNTATGWVDNLPVIWRNLATWAIGGRVDAWWTGTAGADPSVASAFTRCLDAGFVEAAVGLAARAPELAEHESMPRLRSALAAHGRCLDEVAVSASAGSAAFWKFDPIDREIARLVALGRSNADVATATSISTHVVSNRLKFIYRATGVNNRVELSRVLIEEVGSDILSVSNEPHVATA